MKKIQSKLLSEFSQIDHYIIGKPFCFRCPFYLGDDKKIAIQSRKRLADSIGFSQEQIVILNQIHSDIVAVIDEDNYKSEIYADAAITQQKNIFLCVLASDCVPVLLLDSNTQTIAVIHAGRKGLEENIIGKTLLQMFQNFNSKIETTVAYIGPCISQENYELGKEIFDQFGERYNSEIVESKNKEKYLLAIRTIAQKQLIESGILAEQVELSKYCTYEKKDMFHSYRRKIHTGEKGYGNNLLGIYLKE